MAKQKERNDKLREEKEKLKKEKEELQKQKEEDESKKVSTLVSHLKTAEMPCSACVHLSLILSSLLRRRKKDPA